MAFKPHKKPSIEEVVAKSNKANTIPIIRVVTIGYIHGMVTKVIYR